MPSSVGCLHVFLGVIYAEDSGRSVYIQQILSSVQCWASETLLTNRRHCENASMRCHLFAWSLQLTALLASKGQGRLRWVLNVHVWVVTGREEQEDDAAVSIYGDFMHA